MNLDTAIVFAVNAHKGQTDKGGNPYILHPLAVMNRVSTINEKIAALLHDVVEDTEYTFKDLKDIGFSEEIISAVDALTRKNDESYMTFIRRTKENKIARIVKMADIEENMDLSRLKSVTDEDEKRNKKYQKALRVLKEE